MMGPGMMGYYGGYGWSGGLVSLFITLVVIAAVIWLVVWAVNKFTSGTGRGGTPASREILQTRYARGEISREQYQEILKDLS